MTVGDAYRYHFGRGVLLVSESDLRLAVRSLYEEAGIVAEASGAAAVAALLSGKVSARVHF